MHSPQLFGLVRTNAAAESFNAKIKEFRRQFRGVTDIKFFLYRLCKIYA
ncbi:MAG: transposase [Porphyromonadaceae bacterium]|nr:transposase [Porphyromonadaceae bacterium]